MKALDLKHIFHKELDAIYDKNEVETLFYLCIEFYSKVSRIQLALDTGFTLLKSEANALFEALEALKQQEPIQYILGETEFYGLKFKVNNSVLIPRQETEELVDLIINCHLDKNKNSQVNILDVGTGSGCIAICLAKHIKNAKVYALDVSSEALKVARQNAELNNVEVNFIQYDILNSNGKTLTDEVSKFDCIVSNPPYVRELEKQEIKPNVLNYEPHLALFVEDSNPLQFYISIANFALKNLRSRGHLFFEINQYLGEETKQLLEEKGFVSVELQKDLNGNNRILKAIKPTNAMSKMKNIAVFCGSSLGNDEIIIEHAKNLGKTLAEQNITLVYGGAKIGIMGTVAKAVLNHNGKAIGVIPKFLKTKEIANTNLTEFIETENMHDRKVIIYNKSDGFIILPGGFGSMDELFEISTWGQLGLHSKPIGILNSNGYYNPLIKQFDIMVKRGFLKDENRKAIVIDTTIEGLLEKMNNYVPLPKPEWLNKG